MMLITKIALPARQSARGVSWSRNCAATSNLKRIPLNRRALLRGAGGIAIGLPFLEAMEVRRAGAAAAGPIKRIVVFFTPNATNDSTKFVPAAVGPSFVLPEETAPLEPLHKHLLIVSGVNMESAKKDDGDHHSIGMSHMLTATQWVPAQGFEKPGGDEFTVGFAGGISVDQQIAKKVGAVTR